MKRFFRQNGRVETVLQAQATECGVAALAMFLTHFDRYVPLEELRRVTGVSRDGSNARIMIAGARHYGVALKPILVEPHELAARGFPLIAHMNFGHFVVIEAMDNRWVQINDPSGGRRNMTVEEFDVQFTGVAFTGRTMPGSKPVGRPASWLKLARQKLAPFKWELCVSIWMGLLQGMAIAIGVGFLQTWIDGMLEHRPVSSSGVFFVLLLVGVVAAWAWRAGFGRVEKTLMWRETQRLLRHLIRLPHAFFAYRFPGGLHGAVYGCRDMAKQVHLIGTRITGALSGMVLLTGMFWYHPPLAGLVWGLCFVQMGAVFWIRHQAELFSTEASPSGQSATSYAANMIERIETLKTGGMDVEYMAQVSGNMAYGVTLQHRRVMWDAWEHFVETGVQALALLSVLGLGAVAWAADEIAIGGVAALVLLSAWGLNGVRGLGILTGDVRKLRDLIVNIEDVHEEKAEEDETDMALGMSVRPVAVGVALKNVTFGYSHARPARLHGIDLQIPSGKIIGISGSSGGGKSTIAGIIAGLHRPWSGCVEVDGHDLLQWSSNDLAHTIALVDKTIFLFDGTVRENLRLWDEAVSDETLWQAVRDAELETVLAHRGEGLDCRVMERGLNFSGGQRQRLEIARALARNPALLILDEANDAMEVALEQQMMAHLRRRGCTVVIMTHREETLRQCDVLVKVEAGRIVASGAMPGPLPDADRQATHSTDAAVQVPQKMPDAPATGFDEAALKHAFSQVAGAMGLAADRVALHTSGAMAIYELARHHNVLIRRLVLTERAWWDKDCGPLLAFRGADKQPVALLPVAGGGYQMRDPATGAVQKLTKAIASRLDDRVFMLHGRLPDGPQNPPDLFRFSFLRQKLDILSVVITGLAVTGLAWIWPMLGMTLFSTGAPVMPAVLTLLLAGLSGGLLGVVSHIAQSRLFAQAGYRAHTAFWDRIVRLPVAFIRRHRAETLGQMANGLTGWFAHGQAAVRNAWFALPALACVAVLCGLRLTLALCVTGALLCGLMASVYLTKRMCKVEPVHFNLSVRTSAFLFDLLRGLRRLRAANNRLRTVEKWESMLQERLAMETRMARLAKAKDAVVDGLPLFGLAGFAVGLRVDALETPGQIIAASVAVMGLVVSMRALSGMLCAMAMGKPQKERLTPVLAEPTEAMAFSQRDGISTTDARCDTVLDGVIAVRGVAFRYTDHSVPALLDVSLEVPAGKITVISGPSGCGKSTLLRVILGYLLPQQGAVLYDGVTLGGWHLDVLRAQIGAVLQEDALWDGILRNNISGMAPYALDEVWEALRLVDLDRDVDKMPRKVNTFAAEATLSTGQKQRLVMARQLIRKPRVLILDEATSALDEATEARVFANLRTLNLTCVCVAHRESTLAHADRIYRMRDGRIIAQA